MNFKKILVLLMALIMVVGACAPAISAFDFANIKEKGEEVVEGAQASIDDLVAYVTENYVELYAEGYAYARENGYIDVAIEAVGNAIVAVESIDVSGLPFGDELKDAIQYEIESCAGTLGLIQFALECEDIEWLMFVAMFITLDLEWHMESIRDIYVAAAEDEQFQNMIEDVKHAIVSVDAAVNAALDRAYEVMVEKLIPLYDSVNAMVEMTVEAYESLVRTIAEIHTTIVRAHRFLVDVNNTTVEILASVKDTFEFVMENYSSVIAALVEFYGEVAPALEVAAQVYGFVIDFVSEYKGDVKEVAVKARQLYSEILGVVVDVYDGTREALAVAKEIHNAIFDLFAKVNSDIYDAIYDAFNGEFVLTENSHYLALGDAPYAEELAGMVHLGNKFDKIALNGNYDKTLVGADLVTIDFTDDTLYDFAVNQVMGKLAGIVRGHEGLMGWYNDEKLVGPYIREALTSYGIDINAEVVELDWSLYLDEEGKAALDSYLASMKQEVIELGIPETYVLHLGDVVLEAFAQNGYYFPGLTITLDVEIPVADLVVYAVENIVYKHAEFTYNVLETLENVNALAPNATVVITGLGNPFAGLVEGLASIGIETQVAELALDVAIETLNVQLLTNAFIYDNVIFVHGNSAEDIYNAINFTCAHVYDKCEDVECNLCGEVREPAAHVFTKYVFNNDSTCTTDGTETATCENCDKTDTRVKYNSKTGHAYSTATCLAPMTCSCGATLGVSAPHTFGEWSVVTEPTDITEGVKEHTCTLCGHVETGTIPVVTPVVTVPGIIGIVVLAVAVICGASAGFCYYKKKKNS